VKDGGTDCRKQKDEVMPVRYWVEDFKVVVGMQLSDACEQ
jgi:hypothetical protein